MIRCEACNEREARIHVTDVAGPAGPDEDYDITEQHLCHQCAARVDLPNVPSKPQLHQIWQLLGQVQKPQASGQAPHCPNCGMTLAEFRSKGRLGCAHDYEVFADHLMPLLERIHNATEHVGRTPFQPDPGPSGGIDLERELREAIAAEDYERAAALRDALRERSGSGPAD
ncbi:MAG: UvrB/UvrC motif-containing protein [Planctomycetota bacterium]|jgi:protein arginine kinase activator